MQMHCSSFCYAFMCLAYAHFLIDFHSLKLYNLQTAVIKIYTKEFDDV